MAGEPPSTQWSAGPEPGGVDDTVPASDLPGHHARIEPAELSRIERYQLGAEIGRGGMGRVVEAFDVQLGRSVALKEVLAPAGSASARRFRREVQLTARLEHPSIVPLYDSGTMSDGRPYYVMRRVSGRPFDQLIARARGLGERLVLVPALLSAIDAIAHAHRRGVIHRDLKPANILVGDLGETVVIDWGLAKVIGEDDEPATRDSLQPCDSLQTQIGAVFGTPGFMAPEQARGDELGPRSDVYALGATLYQLLAGKPPHAGNSATEVLDRTLHQKIVPLEKLAPGAPAELVTIVTKALAHEAEDRYPDAGALGEDVRRFLAGQLVAAHRYTTQQRLARFGRRHRAALAVAALATVAVAVMAWVGVHRIVAERDAAHRERGNAERGQRAAEVARREVADRHDALLVAQARGLIDSNPTAALATLKQLAPTSRRLDEARAVAQAAAMRGVAWAIEGPTDLTTIAELSPDGKRLLQVSRNGMVRIWDLSRRQLMRTRPFAETTRALWVTGGRLLITQSAAAPVLLDPVTDAIEPLSIEPISYALASAAGTHVVFTTASGVGYLDVATHRVQSFRAAASGPIAIAPDGSWIAYTTANEVIVVDAGGRELARRAATAIRLTAGAHRRLAVLEDRHVLELDLGAGPDARPIWTEPGLPTPRPVILDVTYRGRDLVMTTSVGLLAWNGTRNIALPAYDRIGAQVSVVGAEVLVIPTADHRLHFVDGVVRGAVMLPVSLTHMRVATRRGASQVMVVGPGIIVGVDLADVLPRTIPQDLGEAMAFVDDDTLLAWHLSDGTWHWIDLATGERTRLRYEGFGIAMVVALEADGRVLVREERGSMSRLVLLRKGSLDHEVIATGAALWARLLPGGAVIHGGGDGRVLGRFAGEPSHEVAKLEGISDGGAPNGVMRFVAHSSVGELVRGDLRTGTVERARVAVGTAGALASTADGRVLIAEDDRLLLWDRTVTALFEFEKRIAGVGVTASGLVAVRHVDNEVQLIEPRPGARPHRLAPASKHAYSMSADGTTLIGVGNRDQIEVIELPSRARWSLPLLYSGRAAAMLSPRQRRVLQDIGPAHVVWQLPEARGDLGAWLDERTNATVDGDGLLLWPWQIPTR